MHSVTCIRSQLIFRNFASESDSNLMHQARARPLAAAAGLLVLLVKQAVSAEQVPVVFQQAAEQALAELQQAEQVLDGCGAVSVVIAFYVLTEARWAHRLQVCSRLLGR